MSSISKQFQWGKCGTPSLVLVASGVMVYLYFKVMKMWYTYEELVHKDMMNVKVIDVPWLSKGCCSWWPVSHFVLFAIVTFVWPQCWAVYFTLGVAWEAFEKLQKILFDRSAKFAKTRNLKTGDIEYSSWWDSSMKDILFNSMGIALGAGLASLRQR